MSDNMHLFIRGEIGFTGKYQWSDGSFHSEAEKIEPTSSEDVCSCEDCMDNDYYDDYEESYYGGD